MDGLCAANLCAEKESLRKGPPAGLHAGWGLCEIFQMDQLSLRRAAADLGISFLSTFTNDSVKTGLVGSLFCINLS
jgi:hypothetical protein